MGDGYHENILLFCISILKRNFHSVHDVLRKREAYKIENSVCGNFLAVQWLGIQAFTAEGPGSISGPGTKSCKPHGMAKRRKNM